MNNNRVLLILILLFFSSGFFVHCANPSAPTGGPRDSIAPRVVSMLPANYSTNFKGGKIYIEFNEYVQLKDVQKEVLISPPLDRRPTITTKGRGVLIDFNSDIKLDSATTYKIDFGRAIVDNNESNPLLNFIYVFSTGPYIDSMVMSGQVVNSFSADSILNSIILFFDKKADSMSYDSTIFIGKPISMARTDSSGVFIATNLKPMDYRIYAIEDKNGNAKYETGDDQVAFLDSSYNPQNMPPFNIWWNEKYQRLEATPQILLKTFVEPPVRRQSVSKVTRNSKYSMVIEYAARNPKEVSIVIDSVDTASYIFNYSRYRDTTTLWFDTKGKSLPDTLKGYVSFLTTDSIGRDTMGKRAFKLPFKEFKKEVRKGEVEKNPFRVSVESTPPINPSATIDFKFMAPLSLIVKDSITLRQEIKEDVKEGPRGDRRLEVKKDDTKPADFEKIDFSFEQDTTDIMLWHLTSKWRPGLQYELDILPSAFVNILGEKNDSLNSKFNIMHPDKYAKLIVNVVADSGKMYILELVNRTNSIVRRSKFIGAGETTIDFVPPGEGYKLKVTEDKNSNGKWDTGNIINRIGPERIEIYKDDKGSSNFEAKEKWDIVMNIDMNNLFDKIPTKVKSSTKVIDNEQLRLEKEFKSTQKDSLDNGGKIESLHDRRKRLETK